MNSKEPMTSPRLSRAADIVAGLRPEGVEAIGLSRRTSRHVHHAEGSGQRGTAGVLPRLGDSRARHAPGSTARSVNVKAPSTYQETYHGREMSSRSVES